MSQDGMIEMNIRQLRVAVLESRDLKPEDQVELVQIPEWNGTVEMRLPSAGAGAFINRDGRTEY
jgi:hypothetical protein